MDFYWNRFASSPLHPVPGNCNLGENSNLVAVPMVLSLISDFAIWFLPIIPLAKLHTSSQRKLALVALFSLGLVWVSYPHINILWLISLYQCLPLRACAINRTRDRWGLPARSSLYAVEEALSRSCSADTRSINGTARLVILTPAVQNVGIICACGPHIVSQIQNFKSRQHTSWSMPGNSSWYKRSHKEALELESRFSPRKEVRGWGQSSERLRGGFDTTVARVEEGPDGLSLESDKVHIRTDVECTAENRHRGLS